MARYKITYCKDCQHRNGECHSTCKEYKEQRAEYDETMSELKAKNEVRNSLNNFMFNNIERTNKHLNRKGR